MMKESVLKGPMGLAQKLYFERRQEDGARYVKSLHPWPLLETLLQSKCLGYVDYALAGRLMDVCGINEESVAALICHLSLSARRGHLCVTIEADGINPSPEEIWVAEQSDEESDEASLEMLQQLDFLIREGAAKLIPPLVCDVSTIAEVPVCPICKDGNRYYLQRYWIMESGVIDTLQSMQDGWSSALMIDQDCARICVEGYVKSGNLLEEQAKGIIRACENPLSFITGGPGTGKTYTAGLLLRTVWKSISEEKRQSFTVALAAPTGKAAANLETSMRKVLDGSPMVKGQTLHQLLGIGKGFGQAIEKDIAADLVIVDESSMIDVRLMKRLLGAMKPGAHLVLLGDRHQLASIEAGSLFADLITHFSKQPPSDTCVTELTVCLRAELREVIDLAKEIKAGAVEQVLEHFNGKWNGEGVRFIEYAMDCSAAALQKQLVKYAVPLFPGREKLSKDPLTLLREFLKFRLLTPMRQGPLGVEALNEAIHQAMEGRLEWDGVRIVPIMIIENDHSLELFNGEAGLLFRHPEGNREKDYALFPSREEVSEARQFPFLLLPRHEMAYCMTVHKSQGSEFDHVLLVLGDGAEMFGREGLYTGVTRAKRAIEVWSRPEIIAGMIARQAIRRSGVVERLNSLPFD